MAYKMNGSKFYGKGNQSPLKQDYTTQTVTDEDLEKSRKRMNAKTDAIEKIKSMSNEPLVPSKAEDYVTKGEKEGIVAINKQLKNREQYQDRQEKLKKWREGNKKLLNWVDERNSKKFRDMMDEHMDIDPSKEIKIKKT